MKADDEKYVKPHYYKEKAFKKLKKKHLSWQLEFLLILNIFGQFDDPVKLLKCKAYFKVSKT